MRERDAHRSIEEYRSHGAKEQELFAQGEQHVWDKCTVTLHFHTGHDVAKAMALAGNFVGIGEAPQYTASWHP